MIFNLVVLLSLAIIVTVFAVSNSGAVTVNLILWQAQQVSLAVVIMVSVLAGVIFTAAIALYQKFSDAWKIYQLEGRVKELEKKRPSSELFLPKMDQ